MKHLLYSLITIFIVTSCNSQNSAISQAKETQAAITTIKPGTMQAAEGGWMMTAKLNGKDWKASSLMPPKAASRIIGYYHDEYIGLPYNNQYLVAGKKIALGEGEAVDISFPGIGLAITKKGEMEITKVATGWAEGTFYFTATTSGTAKMVEVKDGFFRIKIK
ncbi:hypothetical protein ACX0G9_30765 [Flavitalea flava]